MLLRIDPAGVPYLDTSGLAADEFWPYTTVVCDRVLELTFTPDADGSRRYTDLMEAALSAFGALDDSGMGRSYKDLPVMRNGWRAARDNKVAFGFRREGDPPEGGGRPVYLGFYDNRVTVGLGVRPERSAVETALDQSKGDRGWRMHDAVLPAW